MSSKSSKPRSLFMLLFLLCTSVLSVSATVGLTKKMLNSFNMAAFIATQRYTQPITRQLMVKEAKEALKSLPGGRKAKPSVVSALWVAGGDQIVFASSAKGPGTVPGSSGDELQIPTLVQDALKKCAADFGKHNYDGKCGEIMAISEWLRENPGKSLPKEKVIVTVNDKGVVAPCKANEDTGSSGCTEFLKEMNFDSSEIIDKEPEDEVCELVPPGSPKLGKRACKPSKGAKPTKPPKKRSISNPEGVKPAPRRRAARRLSRRSKHRRSVQPRWN